jgi:hypothetical protein
MSAIAIYHGTPMTPRAALLDVCAGRAMCVSFWRPDDVEVVEAISPYVMFRQRRIFRMDGGAEARGGVVRSRGLDALLPMVGRAAVLAGPMGGNSGRPRRALPAQRRPAQRLALRSIAWSAALAHGRADREIGQTVRPLRTGCARLDRRPEERAGRLPSLSSADGRGRQAARQSVAAYPHDARHSGRARLSVHERRQHLTCAERLAL